MSGEGGETGKAIGEGLIAVARIVKTRGIRGEVAADLLTDFPERFNGLAELNAIAPAGREQLRLKIEKQWLHGGRVILKFAGYDNPENARALVGYELAVPEHEAIELEEDEYYDWQLTNCRVETIGGQLLGEVKEVWHTGAAPILVVRDEGDARTHLIPLAKAICTEIDAHNKLIRVDPPEGLLEM